MKLSIVAVTRNDNHGGDLSLRMQLFINSLFRQCKKHRFHIEIILVEWNPPPDRPRLAYSLDWSGQSEYCHVRIIEVPYEMHCTYKFSDKLPLFQMIGKNVGIRRATGDFVLSTNIDIILSDELFEYLISEELKQGTIYRVDRHDIRNSDLSSITHSDLLSFCRKNIVRKNKRYVIESTLTGENYPIYEPTDIEHCALYNLDCLLHTNACGDFQLMSRHDWERLNAYPEFAMYSMHIDSVFAYMAFSNGIKEICISDINMDCVIYHMEHNSGYKPEDSEAIDIIYMKRGIYCLSYNQLVAMAVNMMSGKIETVINKDNWGFKDLQLNETKISFGSIYEIDSKQPIINLPEEVCNTTRWIAILEELRKEISVLDNESLELWLKRTWFNFLIIRNEFDVYNSFFSKLASGSLEYVVFGASSAFEKNFLPVMKLFDLRPKYIVDNDLEKIGKYVNGIQIRNVETLMDEDKDNTFIFIASKYYDDIKEQLLEMGFKEFWNFVVVGTPYLTMMDFILKYSSKIQNGRN